MKMSISAIMQDNHRHCDELYATAEESVADEDWDRAEGDWKAFAREFDEHVTRREEGQLFPALEAAGGPAPPIAVMRSEHEQMRALVAQMEEALAARERQQFLGLGETLMLLTQQHNMKEENILYPIMDQMLPEQADLLQ
jgi:hemerythrin-like domain-containing protein